MENTATQTTIKKILSNKKILSGLAILVLVIAGVSYYQTHKTTNHVLETNTLQNSNDPSQHFQTPAPLTARQKQQLETGKSTTVKEKTFYITAGNYYFTPNKIVVNQGDKIAVVLTNTLGTHDFVISEFKTKSPILQSGKLTIINFTAEKKGTFTFYSSISHDQEQGMKGTLVVNTSY